MTAREPRRALLDTSVLIDFPASQVAEIADEVAISIGDNRRAAVWRRRRD